VFDGGDAAVTKRQKDFFFEKKKQKTFARRHTRTIFELGRVRQRAKVFCFFFSKKKSCLLFSPHEEGGLKPTLRALRVG
jgi:hypothetical protein